MIESLNEKLEFIKSKKENQRIMKKYLFMALAAAVLCVLFASCDKDNDDIIPSSDDKEATYYDYSENGFFMNGDIKIRGYFDRDSIMEGYTKYVRRTAHYRTVDGEEGEFVFGFGLVVGINDLARFYSDDITYNADSTAITCHGQIEFAANAAQPYDADITAVIDSIGKPHLVTCYSTVGGKPLVFQFRQTYTKSEYEGERELPREDEFSI